MPPNGVLKAPDREWARRDGVSLAVLSVLGILLTLAHRLSADEGQILTGAWNLFNGRVIYRDFFEFIGPGSFAWIGLSFRVFGPSYYTALFASQLLFLVSIWAFYACTRILIAHRGVAIAACVIWILAAATPPFINHNSHSTFVASAFCLVVLRAGRDPRIAYPFLAGTLGATTFFFLQPKGGAVLLAGFLMFCCQGRGIAGGRWPGAFSPQPLAPGRPASARADDQGRFLLYYLAGAALVGLVGFLTWGFNPLASLLVMARGTISMNHLSLSYLALGGFLALGILIALASWREGLLDRAGVFLLLLQGSLWASAAHLPDIWHLWINSFPLIIMIGRLADSSFRRTQGHKFRRVLASLFVVVALLGFGRAITRNVLNTRVSRTWISGLNELLGGADFYAYTFLPSFYLELQVPNPYFNSVLYVGNHPREHLLKNLDALKKQAPPFILLDYESVAKYGHQLDNPIDDYLRARYRRSTVIPHGQGTIEVWERLES